ncbi:g1786 [Coccomyxa viridis]|uniref:G1786 protein n=1 Tax=Coccomyxa viridis TaxID=1274662 RepID=A0ABP1FQQ7_9CHLO
MEDRERQTFVELKNKMVDQSMKLKNIQQHITVMARKGRRSALTAEELKGVPEDAKTFRNIGKAYFLAPRNEIISDLQQSQQIMASEINDLNANKTALEKSLKGVEAELRELLTSSPALAQQLAQQEA